MPITMSTVTATELLDLAELCDRFGVTPRTVRYYVQQGLLPSPGLGSGARYGQEHRDRLQLIRQLQKQHLPLAEIRRQLEVLDVAAVRALLEHTSPSAKTTVTEVALDPAVPTTASAPLASAADYVRAALSRSSPMSPPERLASPSRSQWERIALAPDVELHVRRPLLRDEGRRVDRLVDIARQILNEP